MRLAATRWRCSPDIVIENQHKSANLGLIIPLNLLPLVSFEGERMMR